VNFGFDDDSENDEDRAGMLDDIKVANTLHVDVE
jgi:hypothetical protein